ncbi:ATP-dependent helicase brm-like [Uloborus diversus]|uniref:ATP-dependent helicase brm-like n=1 Tax=Uloborus diversus TaxID=327109 RepID=UPI002409E6A3|nr:ATP-dependent helicase brm-like [Uloborus diversus]XP_054706395.1 ATP-dependent helicase brm-like [Uloborus diversus]
MLSIKLLLLLFAVGWTTADERQRRQAPYGAYEGSYNGAASYSPQRPQEQAYQPQQAYGPPQGYGPAQAARPQRPRGGSAPDEEEKDEGPHPLQLLLEKSKFECGGKSDGYYADSDVGCQAFHYCVSGQKHSMMCPEGTVFHQVHLNCVPADQDICSKANQFYFVNDYLNKQLDQRGPNNTIQYAQRYYPEGYAVGDPFIPPKENQQREPPAATYGLGPAYREQAPPQNRPQQAVAAHRPQPAAYGHQQQSYAAQRPAPQPARPVAYQQQQPARPAYQQQPARPAAYQPQQPARPAAYQPAHRAVAYQPQEQAQPVAYGYGANAEQAHLQQALQAQQAYAQQQQSAQHYPAAPQQHLYGAEAQRPRYVPQF